MLSFICLCFYMSKSCQKLMHMFFDNLQHSDVCCNTEVSTATQHFLLCLMEVNYKGLEWQKGDFDFH